MDGPVTAFLESRIVARGARAEVMRELEEHYPGDLAAIRVFDDGSGRVTDLEALERFAVARDEICGRADRDHGGRDAFLHVHEERIGQTTRERRALHVAIAPRWNNGGVRARSLFSR